MFLNSAKIYVHHASSEIKPALLLYAKGLYFGITDHPSTKASFNHMNFSIRVLNSEAGASVSFCMISRPSEFLKRGFGDVALHQDFIGLFCLVNEDSSVHGDVMHH